MHIDKKRYNDKNIVLVVCFFMADENKRPKTSLKDMLFGSNGKADYDYNLIYFAISLLNTDKGMEQYVNVIYGDGTSVFTNMFPINTIIFQYNNNISDPKIKLNRGMFNTGSKAEILLPEGFTFYGTGMRPVVAATQEEQNFGLVDEADQGYTPIVEQGASIDNYINTPVSQPKPKSEYSSKPTIPDHSEFSEGFDHEHLDARIEKFLARHDSSTQDKNQKQIEEEHAEVEEVKQETVLDEMNRIEKNAEILDKIRNEASEETVTEHES